MKKVLKVSGLFLIIISILAGCGSSNDEMTIDTDTSTAIDYGAKEETNQDYGEAIAGNAVMEDYNNIADEEQEAPQVDSDLKSKVDNRKYILTFRFYLETLEYEKTIQELEQMVEMQFGFFESSESEGGSATDTYRRRRASYTIRIPKEKVDTFTKGLGGIGNIVNKSRFTEDVTGQYYDTEARIKTLEIQEERLLAILEEADNLEYIIELERELSDVRYQIESYSSSFRHLNDQINYSTVYVEIQEVKEPTIFEEEPETFFEKMSKGFMDSIDRLVDFFANLILFLTTNSPVLILLGLIVYLVYRIVKRNLNKEKRKINKSQSTNDLKNNKPVNINENNKNSEDVEDSHKEE